MKRMSLKLNTLKIKKISKKFLKDKNHEGWKSVIIELLIIIVNFLGQ